MKTIIKTTIAALTLVVGASAGQAQAETVLHFPYKSAPYATQSAPVYKAASVHVARTAKHQDQAARVRTASKKQVIR